MDIIPSSEPLIAAYTETGSTTPADGGAGHPARGSVREPCEGRASDHVTVNIDSETVSGSGTSFLSYGEVPVSGGVSSTYTPDRALDPGSSMTRSGTTTVITYEGNGKARPLGSPPSFTEQVTEGSGIVIESEHTQTTVVRREGNITTVSNFKVSDRTTVSLGYGTIDVGVICVTDETGPHITDDEISPFDPTKVPVPQTVRIITDKGQDTAYTGETIKDRQGVIDTTWSVRLTRFRSPTGDMRVTDIEDVTISL